MALLYWTKDVRKLIEEKLKADAANVVLDDYLSEEKRNKFINELRIFQKYANELLEEMEDRDEEDDLEKAEREARKAAEREAAEKEGGTGDQ